MRLELAAVDIDVQAHIDAVRADAFWQFAAETWYELYAPFVPYDTGALCETVEISPGEIHHTMGYAQQVYEGDFQFRKDVHPLATGYWDAAAAQTRLPLLENALQAYVDAGRLNIGKYHA